MPALLCKQKAYFLSPVAGATAAASFGAAAASFGAAASAAFGAAAALSSWPLPAAAGAATTTAVSAFGAFFGSVVVVVVVVALAATVRARTADIANNTFFNIKGLLIDIKIVAKSLSFLPSLLIKNSPGFSKNQYDLLKLLLFLYPMIKIKAKSDIKATIPLAINTLASP